jgi:hypothetical protein
MFEKEAEEWWNNKYRPSLYDNVSEVWQDGAEFGYNKANEWHYVKDGDLPKEFDKPYLCKVNSHFEVGYFMAYKEQPWHFDEYYLDNEDVIAWKEIVLPKEIKEK